MTRNLANRRHGIPRGGLRAPTPFVSDSTAASQTRPAAPRGCSDDSPSASADGLK